MTSACARARGIEKQCATGFLADVDFGREFLHIFPAMHIFMHAFSDKNTTDHHHNDQRPTTPSSLSITTTNITLRKQLV
jgi:hypothetical protein